MTLKPGVILRLVVAIAIVVVVILGRVETFHMTEGEALVAGWPYWSAAVVLALVGALVNMIAVKKNEDDAND